MYTTYIYFYMCGLLQHHRGMFFTRVCHSVHGEGVSATPHWQADIPLGQTPPSLVSRHPQGWPLQWTVSIYWNAFLFMNGPGVTFSNTPVNDNLSLPYMVMHPINFS